MEKLPENMNWDMFKAYVIDKYSWFGDTTDTVYPETVKDGEESTFTRMDHILSDMSIDEGRRIITLYLQEGDKMIDEIKTYIIQMNRLIRKKYDCFFKVEYVDYV